MEAAMRRLCCDIAIASSPLLVARLDVDLARRSSAL
jgi:hypothetical protein